MSVFVMFNPNFSMPVKMVLTVIMTIVTKLMSDMVYDYFGWKFSIKKIYKYPLMMISSQWSSMLTSEDVSLYYKGTGAPKMVYMWVLLGTALQLYLVLPILKEYCYSCATNVSWFGVVIFVTSMFFTMYCVMMLDKKIRQLPFLLEIIFLVYIMAIGVCCFTNNYIFFFLGYETLLVMSAIFLYFSSPNKSATTITLYFLLWTQMGSFLVFLAMVYMFRVSNVYTFMELKAYFGGAFWLNFVAWLLFLGFAMKIPLWPFHYWLTKTHVEANTPFSIYLSGILVKMALLGLYSFNFFFDNPWKWVFFALCIMTLMDAVMKLWVQDDLKKIVAYLTVIEMSLITALLLMGGYNSLWVSLIFIVFHSMVSALFFYMVECVYKRQGNSSATYYGGLYVMNTTLSAIVILATLLVNGMPLTPKFNLEVILLMKTLNYSLWVLCVTVLFGSIMAALMVYKKFLFLLFGDNCSLKAGTLSHKEYFMLLMLFLMYMWLIFYN